MPDKDQIDLSMFLAAYLHDAKEGFQAINSALLALEKDHSQTGRLDEICRAMHNLKSSAAMLEFSDIPSWPTFAKTSWTACGNTKHRLLKTPSMSCLRLSIS